MVDAERDFLVQEKVYEHLGEIIDRVVVEKPQDAHGLVEVLSRLIKEKSSAEPEPSAASVDAEKAVTTKLDGSTANVVEVFAAPPTGETNDCELTDFMSDASVLSWAGVGFGEQESYKIMCSLRRLALAEKASGANGIKSLRFWGKLLGTDLDYYVAEAGRGGGAAHNDERIEVPGEEGANKYLYYVTTDLCGEWTILPDVRPWHIMASRQIKKLVTGNLEADVITHPCFPELDMEALPKPAQEKYLVRALIARISADTIICLKGFVEADPSGIGTQPNESDPPWQYPSTTELATIDAWMHFRPYVLKTIGRTRHLDDPGGDPPGEDGSEKKVVLEAVPEELRPLRNDGLSWMVKQLGDTTQYSNPVDKDGNPKCEVVTCLRCLTWPGAVTCVRSGLSTPMHQLVSIYVGYGLPSDEPDFFFRAPPDVCEEQDVPDEPSDPQGDRADVPREETG